jgi:imidazolonepropionase-like amidohydrolase
LQAAQGAAASEGRRGRCGDEGDDADLITVDGDPLAGISLLADPDRITAVWVVGRPVKGTS